MKASCLQKASPAWTFFINRSLLRTAAVCQTDPFKLCSVLLSRRGQHNIKSHSAFLSLSDCVNRLSMRFQLHRCTSHLCFTEVMPEMIMENWRACLCVSWQWWFLCACQNLRSGTHQASIQKCHHLIRVCLRVCVCVRVIVRASVRALCYQASAPPQQPDWNVNWQCHKAYIVSQMLSYEEIVTGSFIKEMTARICSDFPFNGMFP